MDNLNIKAAKKLVKDYRAITEQQLRDVAEKNRLDIKLKANEIIHNITGFGSIIDCTLCAEAWKLRKGSLLSKCNYCIYPPKINYNCTTKTYKAIEKAKQFKSLLRAVNNRADYIEEIIKNLKK